MQTFLDYYEQEIQPQIAAIDIFLKSEEPPYDAEIVGELLEIPSQEWQELLQQAEILSADIDQSARSISVTIFSQVYIPDKVLKAVSAEVCAIYGLLGLRIQLYEVLDVAAGLNQKIAVLFRMDHGVLHILGGNAVDLRLQAALFKIRFH